MVGGGGGHFSGEGGGGTHSCIWLPLHFGNCGCYRAQGYNKGAFTGPITLKMGLVKGGLPCGCWSYPVSLSGPGQHPGLAIIGVLIRIIRLTVSG